MPPSFEKFQRPSIPKQTIAEIAEKVIPDVVKSAQEQDQILKSVNSLPVEVPRLSEREILSTLQDNFQKAVSGPVKAEDGSNPKSFLFNPFTFTDSISHKQLISGISYNTLHEMVRQSQIISAIVNTRINQVSSFARIPRTKHSLGFRVQKKDMSKPMTDAEKKKAKKYEQFIVNCGEGDAAYKRDYLEEFIRKAARDRLVVDQVNFERVFTKGGQLHEIVAVDAATIRIALRKYFDDTNPMKVGIDTQMVNDGRGLGMNRVNVPLDKKAYVQVLNGQIVCDFTEDEMAFLVAWPRTDVNVAGYGYSEVEQLIQTITAILFSGEYNRRFFSSGSSPKGVLNIKANMNQVQMDGFKKAWLAQLSGITGAWRTPIIAAEGGLEFINMQQTNREMEFSKYNDFLIKVACAVYQIAPEEINFSSQQSTNGQGAIFESKSELRLKASRDKGLVPLLTFFENGLNRNVMRYIDDAYEIVFVGLEGGTELDQVELHEKELKNFKTVNEVRAENDLPPIDGGDIILNSVFAQIKVAEQMTESQKENLQMTQDFQAEQTEKTQQFQVEQVEKQQQQQAEALAQQQEVAAQAETAEPKESKPKAEKKEVKKSVDTDWKFGEFDNFESFAAEIQKGIVTGQFEKALAAFKDSPVEITIESD